MTLKIYNTLTKRVEEFVPLEKGRVKAYFCGLTVNDYMHIGHVRCYIFWDVVKRWLEYLGYKTFIVSNITDISIDDKILNRLSELGISFQQLIEYFAVAYFEDREKLGIARNDVHPSAMQHVQEMIEHIEKLIKKGYAYVTEDGVYFSVSKFRDYGKLSGIDTSSLKAGASGRISVEEYEKEQVADFALWKKTKPGEPYWHSPWGIGRPGWHIECSVMAMKYLSESFDIHGGGEDLIFPHHENEIAQSESVTGKQFSKYWMHVKHVLMNGKKMSKSLKNYITARDAVEKYGALLLRFFFINTHYRSQLNFTETDVEAHKEKLEKIVNTITLLIDMIESGKETKADSKLRNELKETRKRFEDAMNDDFNISLAITHILELVKEINKSYDSEGSIGKEIALELYAFFEQIGTILFGDLFKREIADKYKKIKPMADIMILQRDALRSQKKFEEADAIRKELQKIGITLEDGKNGTLARLVL